MKHPDFAGKFHVLYDQAVKLYPAGQRDPAAWFTADEQAFLAANGLSLQAMYDYAEDHHGHGEPGYDQALAIETVRRDYFLHVQQGKPSPAVLDVATMPAKTAAVQGITWLPRLLLKTKAKLRGELPASLMYCCAGDRNFFRAHHINPAEFLGVVWRHLERDDIVIDWVVRRSAPP